MKVSTALKEMADMLSVAARAADQLVESEKTSASLKQAGCLAEVSLIADRLRHIARKLKAANS